MMHLRQPLQLPKGRELRVLIHARFSTEEQRQSSIDDQIAACRAFLDANLPKGTTPAQVKVDVIEEPEVSGEIDEEKAAVIREVFERIAGGETAAEVGEWLDSIKVAKAKWSRQAKWTASNVNAIVRRTKYRGFETNRVKVSKRKLRKGKSEYV